MSLLRGTVWAARAIRRAPLGLVLLTIGLSFPVGLRVGPVNVTLADLSIGWLTIQLLAGVAIGNRRLAVPLILGWTLFMVGAAGSVVFSQNVGTSVVYLVEKIEMLLIFYTTINLVRRREQINGLLIVLSICTLLNAAFGLAQFAGLTAWGLQGAAFVGRNVHIRGGGFVGSTLGAYLGTGIVLLFAWLATSGRRWRPGLLGLWLFALVGLVFGLVTTLNRTWMFATLLAIAVIVIQLKWRVKFRMLAIGALMMGVLVLALNNQWFSVAGEDTTEFVRQRLLGLSDQVYFRSLETVRYFKWAEAWNHFLSAPIFGVGMGTVRFYNPQGTIGLVDNHYLELLAEMGLVGTIAFLWIAAGALWRTWRATRLTRNSADWGSPAGLLSGQILWLCGGLLWGLFGSGKPGMMYFLIIALGIAYRKVLSTEPRSVVGLSQSPLTGRICHPEQSATESKSLLAHREDSSTPLRSAQNDDLAATLRSAEHSLDREPKG
jgi:O-antigen ligase